MLRVSLVRLFALCLLVVAVFCSTACSGPSYENPRSAAETYYGHLIEGDYEKFVDGMAHRDSMTETYYSQLIDLATHFATREKELRGGLQAVRAVSDTVVGDVALVFLEVSYADSTREDISVPMVRCGDVWKMQ